MSGQDDRDSAAPQGQRLADLGPALTIEAMRSARAGVTIRSFEMVLDGTRLRVAFDEDRPVADVFDTDMADAILSMCRDAPAQAGMVSLPDLQVVLDDCTLSGASVLARVYAEEVTALTIRIRQMQGNALRMLAPGVLNDDTALRAVETAVNQAVERIYLPLRNFESEIESALAEGDVGRTERLHSQIIAFRSEIEHVCFNFERLLAADTARLGRTPGEPPALTQEAEPDGEDDGDGGDDPPRGGHLRLIPGRG
ncbi:hypothetical protein [Roseobacter sp. HKCCA0434]|uniref:hypothetical protein n=1 Tax=Roseobacter sp. HKCCA0434 TaxID=3079297 RepID=UPI002905C75C|nr:hypothetical protein [Roseobacter sp. HKCCA0434]